MDVLTSSQELLLRVGIPLAMLSLIVWIIAYTKLAAWWKTSIGWTLVTKTVLIVLLLALSAVDLYFRPDHYLSEIFLWMDICLIWAIVPIMLWRTAVWIGIHRMNNDKKKIS